MYIPMTIALRDSSCGKYQEKYIENDTLRNMIFHPIVYCRLSSECESYNDEARWKVRFNDIIVKAKEKISMEMNVKSLMAKQNTFEHDVRAIIIKVLAERSDGK